MPYATSGDCRIYYETDGRGTVEGTDQVAFVGDVGFGPWQWAWQAGALAGPFETVVPTTRGCGRSDAPPGPSDVGDLVSDLDAVLADAGADSTHVVGAGLGGLVALHAARRLGRVKKLVLLGTPPTGARYDPAPLFADPADRDALEGSLAAALSPGFRENQPEAVERIVDWRAAEDAEREAWDAQAAALDTADATDWLYEVTNDALVVHGSDDELCPVEAGRDLADGLPRGEFIEYEDAGHLVGVECSKPLNDRLVGFLSD
ncbi:MAG: alpha/beta fold hydrolase [Halobaculum sp.]